MARRRYTSRRRIGPDFGSVLVMVGIVGAVWLLFGWSPLGFGLTLACVVIVLTAVEAAVLPRRRTTRAGKRGER